MKDSGYIGILYGSEKGAGLSCKVFPRGNGLEVQREGELVMLLPYASMNISVTGMDNKYLCFAVNAENRELKVLVGDKSLAQHIEMLRAPRNIIDDLRDVKIHGRNKKIRTLFILGAIAAVIALLVSALWATLGLLTERIVEEIPISWEVELGNAAADNVLAKHNVCNDQVLNTAIQEIGQRLMMGLGATPYQWSIKVLDSKDVNAFALPGGHIFINRGLIERAEDPSEVAGVLAHEIQHVTHRHGMKNIVSQAGLMIIVYALVGNTGAVEQFLVGNAAHLAAMSFSRDQETEADVSGMELIYNSKLDPTGLSRFMFTLAAEENFSTSALNIISTHPVSQDRGKLLEHLIKNREQSKVRPLASEANWKSIKVTCN